MERSLVDASYSLPGELCIVLRDLLSSDQSFYGSSSFTLLQKQDNGVRTKFEIGSEVAFQSCFMSSS